MQSRSYSPVERFSLPISFYFVCFCRCFRKEPPYWCEKWARTWPFPVDNESISLSYCCLRSISILPVHLSAPSGLGWLYLCFLRCGNGHQDGGTGNFRLELLPWRQVEPAWLCHRHGWVSIAQCFVFSIVSGCGKKKTVARILVHTDVIVYSIVYSLNRDTRCFEYTMSLIKYYERMLHHMQNTAVESLILYCVFNGTVRKALPSGSVRQLAINENFLV